MRDALIAAIAALDTAKQDASGSRRACYQDAIKACSAALASASSVETTMANALAAGDGTLHGAIDHWQERALAAEARLRASAPANAAHMPYYTADHLHAYAQAVADERVRAALERGFEAGWCTAANWMERNDLAADIGSPAYIADRDAALAVPTLSLDPSKGTAS